MNPGLDSDQLEATSCALSDFFRSEILPSLPGAGLDIFVLRVPDLAFDSTVETITNREFWITLNDGCVETAFRALNTSDAGDLNVAAGISEQLFGDRMEVDAVLGAILNAATVFILLHEYSHIVCGHFHATPAEPGAGFQMRAFGETGTAHEAQSPGVAMGGVTASQARKVFELEADATAYELLIDRAADVFLASPGIRRAIRRRKRRAKLSKADTRTVQRMTFYACSLVAALTEGVREQAGAQSEYPGALTRMMNLCLTNVLAFLPGTWRVDEFVQKLSVEDKSERFMVQQIAPTIGHALDFCRAGCEGVGLQLKLRHDIRLGSVRFSRAFGKDFANLVVGREEQLMTEPGREYAELQRARKLLIPIMAPHRQADWWNVS
jgi:hypothetical protein